MRHLDNPVLRVYTTLVTTREALYNIAKERVLLLDGAMGTMLQALNLSEADYRGERFAGHSKAIRGIGEALCLTKSDAIYGVHTEYLEAGADIIETCSFNATPVSLAEYDLSPYAREISREAARIAKKAVRDYEAAHGGTHFVAGVLGGTSKSASIPQDAGNAEKRAITWDALVSAYYENVAGLLEGGADLFLIETIYDTLNAKAAIFAILRLLEERGLGDAAPPIMLSATVDLYGRLLTGADVRDFVNIVSHAAPISLGLNCSLGARDLLPHIKTLSDNAPSLVSFHPNAGIPQEDGSYAESPEDFARAIQEASEAGLVNIAGGCCGTTPRHIKALKSMTLKPRKMSGKDGAERSSASKKVFFIAGCCNISGSSRFLRCIKEDNYDEAVSMARDASKEEGVSMLDVCMDSGEVDAQVAMRKFLLLALQESAVAKNAVVIDSSDWSVIETGLKLVHGQSVVNSISLKDGEEKFLERALLARKYGARVVVLLFDEAGQAESAERKIEIAERVIKLLESAAFPLDALIIDPNVLAVGTSLSETDNYAKSFLDCCDYLHKKYPSVALSAGIENLSFAFRGNTKLRAALNSCFLHYAVERGLRYAFSNQNTYDIFFTLPAEIKTHIKSFLLSGSEKSLEKLLFLKDTFFKEETSAIKERAQAENKEIKTPRERIIDAIIEGNDSAIENDIQELLKNNSASDILEGPLLDGMREVGSLFSSGKMLLPEVLRSGRVLKKGAAYLKTHFNSIPKSGKKVVLATVKGDVHDIGKNIVGMVLSSSGYDIVDLGVMAAKEKIADAIIAENAAIVGLSGLISPSLREMAETAKYMAERKITIPLIVGGAAASLAHTALHIAPLYEGAVIYAEDAGSASIAVSAVLDENKKAAFLKELSAKYDAENEKAKAKLKSQSCAKENAKNFSINFADFLPPIVPQEARIFLDNFDIAELEPYIDWASFFNKWELNKNASKKITEKEKLFNDGKHFLNKIKKENCITARGIIQFFNCASDDNTIFISSNDSNTSFTFPRILLKRAGGNINVSLADFIINKKYDKKDALGFFVLSCGFGAETTYKKLLEENDSYGAAHISFLAGSLTEAFSLYAAANFAPLKNERGETCPVKIRPAFGFASCPAHEDKRAVFSLLGAKAAGFSLSETAMIIPAESVCGMYFYNEAAFYY